MATAKQKRELAKLISGLKGIRGSGTELISVYISTGYPMSETSNRLKNEYGQAGNIKSKTTRKNVQAALDKIISYLKTFRETPKNGIAIFAGNISKDPGKEDIQLFSVEPPLPIQVNIYRCDSDFMLEPLIGQGRIKEKYGLVTIDGKDATIATLEGNATKIVRRLTTTGPSKSTKGGSCIHEDAKVQLEDGSVIRIADVRPEDKVLSHCFDDEKDVFTRCDAVMKRTADAAYKIVTKHPRTEIIATKEHRFFVRGLDGIEEKYVEDLRVGDALVHATRSPVNGVQKELPLSIERRPILTSKVRALLKQRRKELGLSQEKVAEMIGVTQIVLSHIETYSRKMSNTKILPKLLKVYDLEESIIPSEPLVYTPKEFTPDVCQLLGYALGDGTVDGNRIILYDEDSELLGHYKSLCERSFGLEAVLRKPKLNMYELRVYSKWLRDAVLGQFPELFLKSRDRDIPNIILTLPADCLAAFIRGLFDAEGHVSTRVTIAMRTKHVMEKLRYALLRFGIVSSLYWRKTDEEGVWLVEINDSTSLERFIREIGFSSKKKQNKLLAIRKGADNTRHIPVSGKHVLGLAKQLGLNTRDFPNINMFFSGHRKMSNIVFTRQVVSVLKQQKIINDEQYRIIRYLERVADTEYVSPKIIRIEQIEPTGYFYDLSMPQTENFVVDGLIVHNSAARYQRYVEELIENYYRRVGEAMGETLLPSGITKVIVGGPGPVKDNFLKMKSFNYQFQILAVLDTGYVDDYGIQELAKKAVDVIAEEKAVREKKLLERLFMEIGKGSGIAVYGSKDTMAAMTTGKIETLLLSEKLASKHLKVRCVNGDEEEIVIDPDVDRKKLKCPLDHSVEEILSEKDLFDELYDRAEAKDIDVETISDENPEGRQFLAGFKGVGAILRYR